MLAAVSALPVALPVAQHGSAPVASAPGLVVEQGGWVYVEGRRVTRGVGPVISWDRERIAFTRPGGIYVADRDGRNVKLVLRRPQAYSLAWSPSGKAIAFVSDSDVYTVPASGGAARTVTRKTKPWMLHNTPAYSPDGKTIAFSRSTNEFNSDIFLLRKGRLTRLTRSEGTNDSFGEEHGPSFSPDGKRIVFVSNRGDSWDLYSIGVHGRGERRLTRTPTRQEDMPRWSSDGKRIVYVYGGRVAHMNAAGRDVRELGAGTSADWK
jgi:TolB protein